MTTNIIYHDFRKNNELSVPAPTVALTASVLNKGRKLFKTAERVNTALNTACIFLCGACTAVSLLILILLS